MEYEISAEAYYQQFRAEEKAREAARLAEKEIDIKKARMALAKLRNPCSAKKILEYGQICGCGVQHGGREGAYLVGPDKSRLPVSNHPGDATRGQWNAARKFLERVVEQVIAV